MVEAAYNRSKGLNTGHLFEVDDVIDPADTRRWIVAGMKANAPVRYGRRDACDHRRLVTREPRRGAISRQYRPNITMVKCLQNPVEIDE